MARRTTSVAEASWAIGSSAVVPVTGIVSDIGWCSSGEGRQALGSVVDEPDSAGLTSRGNRLLSPSAAAFVSVSRTGAVSG